MKRKKEKNNLSIVITLFIVLLVLIIIIPFSFSRYESSGESNLANAVAYYVLETSYQYLDVKIPNLSPRVEPYVYNFTVSNYKDGKRAELSLEYDLTVKTTTNLDLTYELYLNENYQSSSAQNIIVSNEIIQDEYDTYFRNITSPRQYFDYRYNETNSYSLIIYFDESFKGSEYQDIIESIYIIIDSRQIVN